MLVAHEDIQKQKTCPNSDPCGEGCIQKGLRCNIELGPEMEDRVSRVRQRLKNLPGLNPVGGFKRTLGKIIQRVGQSGLNNKEKAIEVAIAIGAVSLAAHARARQRIETGIANSADTAELDAKGRTIPDTAGKTDITFTVDGISYGPTGNAPGEVISSALQEDGGFESHQIVPITSADRIGSIPGFEQMNSAEKLVARSIDQSKRFIKNGLVRGGDPLALEMASQILAYDEQTGDGRGQNKPQINVVSYGSGGHITAEALAIVAKNNSTLSNRVRVVNLQTPDLQLVDTPKNVRSIAGRGHPLSIVPMAGKKVVIDGQDDGTGASFVRSPGVMRQLKGAIATTGSIGASQEQQQGASGFSNFGANRPSSFSQQKTRRAAPATRPASGTVKNLTNRETPKAVDNKPAPNFHQQDRKAQPAPKSKVDLNKFTPEMGQLASQVNSSTIFDFKEVEGRFPDMDSVDRGLAFSIGKVPHQLLQVLKEKSNGVNVGNDITGLNLVKVGNEIPDASAQARFSQILFAELEGRKLGVDQITSQILTKVLNDFKSQEGQRKAELRKRGDSSRPPITQSPKEIARLLESEDLETLMIGLRIPGSFFEGSKKEANEKWLKDQIFPKIKDDWQAVYNLHQIMINLGKKDFLSEAV